MHSSRSTLKSLTLRSTPSDMLYTNECNAKYTIGDKIYKERSIILPSNQIITGYYGKLKAFCCVDYYHLRSRYTIFMTHIGAISIGIAASSIATMFFYVPVPVLITVAAIPMTIALMKETCYKRDDGNINLSTFYIISTLPIYYCPSLLTKHIVIEREIHSFLKILNNIDSAGELQAHTNKILIIELYEDPKSLPNGREFFPSMSRYEVSEAFNHYRHRHSNLILKVSFKNGERERIKTRVSIFSNSSGIGSMGDEPSTSRRGSMPVRPREGSLFTNRREDMCNSPPKTQLLYSKNEWSIEFTCVPFSVAKDVYKLEIHDIIKSNYIVTKGCMPLIIKWLFYNVDKTDKTKILAKKEKVHLIIQDDGPVILNDITEKRRRIGDLNIDNGTSNFFIHDLPLSYVVNNGNWNTDTPQEKRQYQDNFLQDLAPYSYKPGEFTIRLRPYFLHTFPSKQSLRSDYEGMHEVFSDTKLDIIRATDSFLQKNSIEQERHSSSLSSDKSDLHFNGQVSTIDEKALLINSTENNNLSDFIVNKAMTLSKSTIRQQGESDKGILSEHCYDIQIVLAPETMTLDEKIIQVIDSKQPKKLSGNDAEDLSEDEVFSDTKLDIIRATDSFLQKNSIEQERHSSSLSSYKSITNMSDFIEDKAIPCSNAEGNSTNSRIAPSTLELVDEAYESISHTPSPLIEQNTISSHCSALSKKKNDVLFK